jgi:peptidyl-prolyl cis-trans isomerase SurA
MLQPTGWTACLLVTCLAGAHLRETAAQSPSFVELNRIVAIVNDDVIVESELRLRLRTMKAQMDQSGAPMPPQEVLRTQVLERLVIERLQIQLAQANGIRVGDEALNSAVSNVAQKNNMSLAQFKEILERDGFDFGKFREEMRNEILIARLQRRQVANRITISDRDIDNFLATAERQGGGEGEYLLQHILIALPEEPSSEQIAEGRARADRVMAQLQGGADFAEVAAEESDGQQALEGGSLGWLKTADLPTIFADVVPTLGKDEVADPLRSSSGFHIVKVADIRGGASRHLVMQTRARHILVQPNELTTEAEAVSRLAMLKIRVENGEDIGELARAHSDDRGTAIQGGDLGWVSPGDTVPNFERMMDTLDVGEVSEPFETRFGWHILQVNERREHDDTEQAKRTNAAEQIRRRKMDEELQNWLRQLRDEAYVELRLDAG